MNIRNKLTALREEQWRLIYMAERCDTLRASLYGKGIQYDVDKVQTSAADTFGDRMAEVVQRVQYIRRRQTKLDSRKDSIRLWIWQIDGDQYRDVLELYYLGVLDGPRLYTWREVASEIGLGEKYVIHSVHPEALRRLNNILCNY